MMKVGEKVERRGWREFAAEWARWTLAITVCLSALILLLFLAYTAPGHWIEMHVMQPFYISENKVWARLSDWFDRSTPSLLIALGGVLIAVWALQEITQRRR
jgi:hypothetical protein